MPTVLHLTIIPKPVEGVPPVKAFCSNCRRETTHFLFSRDRNYHGPIVLMPAAKLLPKKGIMICASCVHMAELSDDNYRKFSKLEGETQQHREIRNALAVCVKKLIQAQKLNQQQQKDTAVNSAIIDYLNATKNAIENTTRQCPYCKEEIKATAIKCKYCQSDVEPLIKNELPTFTKTDYTEKQIIFCAECDQENYVGDKRCQYCGAELWYGGFDEDDIDWDEEP